jgi:GT2 family glycosyltransferase
MGPAMSGVSVLTLVRNREAHLHQLIEGLRRNSRAPDELIVVDMSDRPVSIGATPFPTHVARLETQQLPLAEARNRAAAIARFEHLVFLDVDCIPMRDCLARLSAELARRDGLLCADVRYLGPNDARGGWDESDLLARGRQHPVRSFPASGVREESNPGLFWSLAFAITQAGFRRIGGFDPGYVGYGAEDTDFGFRAAALGIPLLFVGGAYACHQHHESHEPPVQHVAAIVENARRFWGRWGRWPMEGWLAAFRDMGLVAWSGDALTLLRGPSLAELDATRQHWD